MRIRGARGRRYQHLARDRLEVGKIAIDGSATQYA